MKLVVPNKSSQSYINPLFLCDYSTFPLFVIHLPIDLLDNRGLRRILGPKKDVNRERRRIHNGELHSVYRSPITVTVIKSRRLRLAGHVTRLEENRVFKIRTGKPRGMRPLARPIYLCLRNLVFTNFSNQSGIACTRVISGTWFIEPPHPSCLCSQGLRLSFMLVWRCD